MRLAPSLALAALAATLAASSAPANVPGAPHVTIIGDSVATGMLWHDDAIATMQRGLNVDWQVAVCRRLTGLSCPFEGTIVPNVVDLVSSLGAVSPIVVVEMGYNDYESTFAASVEQTIRTLLAHDARHILWLTLREVHHPYVRMNATLAAAAGRHPEVELVDWNKYSRSHPDWFQNDGEHLVEAGGVAMAAFIHLAVDELVNPLEIVRVPTEVAHVGHPYAGRLAARGGQKPYRWQLYGRPPVGLHLLADGRLYGWPQREQRVTVTVRVCDAEGQDARRRLVLAVRS
jgi:hypothetical protein